MQLNHKSVNLCGNDLQTIMVPITKIKEMLGEMADNSFYDYLLKHMKFYIK